MKTNYIVKRKNNLMLSYFHDGEGICENSYYNNHWAGPKKIISKTLPIFSLNIGFDENIYIFCQDTDGNMIVCIKNEDDWHQKTIMENVTKSVHSIQFEPFITERGICLFYHLPAEQTDRQILYQSNLKGNWDSPIVIDSFEPFLGSPFIIQQTSPDHLILYYQKRTPEINIGYREISLSSNKIGHFNIFHTTNYPCVDESFLTTDKAIHTLYIIKGMFSHQLIFKCKQGENFSPPQILWDGQKIGQCILLIIEEKLFALWQSANQMYYSISENNGKNFSRPVRYRGSIESTLSKSFYITETRQREEDIFARQIYVDDDNPSDVVIIPDLYPPFYPEKILVKKTSGGEPAPLVNTEAAPANKEAPSDKVSNKIFLYQQQIKEKDDQLLQYINLMKNRNEEIIAAEIEWKQKIKTLSAENKALKQNIEALKEQQEHLETYNRSLKKELRNKTDELKAFLEKEKQIKPLPDISEDVKSIEYHEIFTEIE